MRREEILLGGGGINCSSLSSSSSSIRCEDCGNQAKRDCEHVRCRTCCKSRGYHCQTHIKSTWIPVAGRKPRYHTMLQQQHQIPALNHVQQQLHEGPNPKRYRSLNNPAADALGLGERNLPGEVSFPAVFRCVRMSSMDNVVDQYAYQTSVSIGGHIFTGILYDQGPSNQPEGTGNYVSGESSSSLQHPNFVNGTTSSIPGPFCAFNPSASSSQLFQYPKY